MEAIVLAGGLGTRLRAEVPDLPKPMAPVAGRPFLEHILDRLGTQGVSRVILSVGFMAEVIIAHFGSSYRTIDLVYAHETEPLGTGGAIRFALTFAKAERVLVLNGDTYLSMDYQALFQACAAKGAALGIVVRMVPDTTRYGHCTVTDDLLVSFSEKEGAGPGLINAGVYCLTRETLSMGVDLPARFSFEQDFVAARLDKLRPIGFPVDGYFIDIGVPEDFRKAQKDFGSGGVLAFEIAE